MKKYIIYTGIIELPDKNAAVQRAMMICNSISDLGFTPIIIGVTRKKEMKFEIVNGFDTYAIPYPASSLEWLNRMHEIDYIQNICRKYGIENINSIIAMDFMAIGLLKLERYCKKSDIQLIVDTVDWFNKSNYKFPRNLVKDFDTKLRMNYVYKKMDYMITISNFLFEHYRNQIKNIILIPATTNLNDSKWHKLKPYNAVENQIIFGYAGNPGEKFEKEKLHWLIKILCSLNSESRKILLYVAGIDEIIVKKNFPELFTLKNFKETVVFLGKINHLEVLNILSLCDFSVIIRENDLLNKAGFPTKLSESFSCGTPVISTPAGDISKYIIPGENGFVSEDFSYNSIRNTILSAIMLSSTDRMEMHFKTKKNNHLKYEEFTETLKKIIIT